MKFLEVLDGVSHLEAKGLLRERFEANLSFFAKTDKKLYGHLTQKPTQFGLIADENGINILNLSANTLVYPADENGRHTAIRSCLEMAKNPLSHTKWKAGFEINPFYMSVSNLERTSPVCKEIFGFCFASGMNPSQISLPSGYLPSAILYGLGGGFALEGILEFYERVDSLFIYEQFADFFAISAYFVDYESLFGRIGHLIFRVGEPPTSMQIREFFYKNRFGSLFPRLELSMYDTPQMQMLKNSVRMEAGSLFRGFGSYEDEIIGWRNSQKNCGYSRICSPVLTKPRKKIDFPICVVGNGGSLDEKIEFLRQNSPDMIIFSAGTALKTLLKNGIKPDFQIEIERTDYLRDILAEAGVGDVDMIAANVVDPNTLSATKGEKFLFFRDYTASSYLDSPKYLLSDASPFVGNAAFSLALNISKNVFLCGIDVGYKKGRGIHSKDSIYEEDGSLPEGSVRVRENFEGSEIYSNHLYGLSRAALEIAASKHPDVKAKNLSDGAYIERISPCKEPKLSSKGGKQKAVASVKSFFSKNRSEIFTRDGLAVVEGEIHKFKNELFAIFAADISKKEDFFSSVRRFESFLIYKEGQNDFFYYLLGGTLRHIVFCMYVSVLHTQTSDFGAFYRTIRGIFFEGVEKIINDFKKEVAKGKVTGLLGGFKAP